MTTTESPQDRFAALFRELEERSSADEEGLALLDQLFRAFNASLAEAVRDTMNWTMANLVLGIRDTASSPEVSDWHGTLPLDVEHFRCRHDDREETRKAVFEAVANGEASGSEDLRVGIDRACELAAPAEAVAS